VQLVVDRFIVQYAEVMATTAPPNHRQSDLPKGMIDWLDAQLEALGVPTAYEIPGEEPQGRDPGEAAPHPGA
jgi:hypothetical protein